MKSIASHFGFAAFTAWTVVLALALLGGSVPFATAAGTKAATITIGSQSESNGWPFAISDSGNALYAGEYQQIYASEAFSEPILITQVAFASQSTVATAVAYNLTLSFGVTTRSPSMPGSDYSGPFSPVFSGSVSAFFTENTSDFDLVVPLAVPFLYDPGAGNLLLDIQIVSATGTSPVTFFRAEHPSSLMGRVYNVGGTGSPT